MSENMIILTVFYTCGFVAFFLAWPGVSRWIDRLVANQSAAVRGVAKLGLGILAFVTLILLGLVGLLIVIINRKSDAAEGKDEETTAGDAWDGD